MLLLIFLKRRRAPHSGSSDLEEREQNPTHREFLPTVWDLTTYKIRSSVQGWGREWGRESQVIPRSK
jgi:hypothetical protein